MAYETGSATGVADLLDKLRIFATANGWTQNYFGARSSGVGIALQLTKGSQHVTFIADTSAGTENDPGAYFGAYSHNAYSAGNGTENQAQGSVKVYANAMTGPYVAYHFMTGAERGCDYLYVCVETTSGTFKHAGVGKLVSLGALNTGMFAFGCRWNYSTSAGIVSNPSSNSHAVPWDSSCSFVSLGTQLRADSDGVSPRWYDCYSGGSFGSRMCGGVLNSGSSTVGGARSTLYNVGLACASTITGRAVLLPAWVYGERTANLGSPLGYPPHMRWVRLDHLNPGDVLTLGSDQWKVFPVIRKNGGAGQVNSATYGYAYKVN